jgi:uncharacterized Zn-binding protein involved in type VI secretion
MAAIHRDGDSRACRATTIASGQSTVFAGGKLISVDGDGNTDGGGALSTSHSTITINGKGIIVVGDSAAPDALCPIPGGAHCAPNASSGLGTVTVG